MKKMVNWGSPIEYQEKRRNPNSHPGIKKWACKKLKGEHEFGAWVQDRLNLGSKKVILTGFWTRYCIGCNKKDHWIAPVLSGEYWELDITARPPGTYLEG